LLGRLDHEHWQVMVPLRLEHVDHPHLRCSLGALTNAAQGDDEVARRVVPVEHGFDCRSAARVDGATAFLGEFSRVEPPYGDGDADRAPTFVLLEGVRPAHIDVEC
jgi:hypothetical protein